MRLKKKLAILIRQIGFDPIELFLFFRGIPRYVYLFFRIFINSRGWRVRAFPILTDKYKDAGSINTQYFIQDIYFARKIFEIRPLRHLDIGSRVDGFIAHLLIFMDVDVVDIRPLVSNMSGLTFRQFDIMSQEHVNKIGQYPSVSCLHTLEHFGLGRYGDNFDPTGWETGLINLLNLVSDNGLFFLSTPIGKKRIEFNAHRVFNPNELIDFVTRFDFELKSFAYLDDKNLLRTGNKDDFSCINYGCGFFIFQKSSKG